MKPLSINYVLPVVSIDDTFYINMVLYIYKYKNVSFEKSNFCIIPFFDN